MATDRAGHLETSAFAFPSDLADEGVEMVLGTYGGVLGGRPLSLALRPSPPDCQTLENLAAKLALARELDIARVDFYHYGSVRLEALDWIRSAIGAH